MLNIEKLSTTTNYTIYLKNEGADGKNFWCFLEKPEGLPTSDVFANSSASLFVQPNYGGTNKFTIPLQYILGAGASNNAVAQGVQIDSSIIKNVQLREVWEADYATVPPNQGPEVSIVQGATSPDGTIGYNSNDFDKVKNENAKWYSSMSFGIQSPNGFLGVTWSPSPSDANTITPKFSFYISTGSFTSFELADIATVSKESAKVELKDFKNLEATVILTSRGTWLVEKGKV